MYAEEASMQEELIQMYAEEGLIQDQTIFYILITLVSGKIM